MKLTLEVPLAAAAILSVVSVGSGQQELRKLLPSAGESGAWFAYGVSLDGGRALVGAPLSDDLGVNSGSAYLLDAVSGLELFKLTPADGAERDWFGVCPYGNDNDGGVGGCDWGDAAFPGGGVLTASGSDRFAGADTYLIATGVSNDFGLFFAADNLVGGGNGSPLTDGLRCAGGNVVRFPLPPLLPTTHSAVSGPLQLIDPGLTVGSPRRYQYWFRTRHGPGGQMANLTNGLEIFWRP